jgi:hypothetical protein
LFRNFYHEQIAAQHSLSNIIIITMMFGILLTTFILSHSGMALCKAGQYERMFTIACNQLPIKGASVVSDACFAKAHPAPPHCTHADRPSPFFSAVQMNATGCSLELDAPARDAPRL